MKPVSARLPVSSISRVEPDALLDLRALRGRALVVPEDRRAQHRTAVVLHHEAVHLPGETDGAVGQPLEHRLRRAPPVLGILLGPAGVGGRERVALLGDGENLAVLGDRDSLDAGGPDVEIRSASTRASERRNAATRLHAASLTHCNS